MIATTLYSPACTSLWDAEAGPGPNELTVGVRTADSRRAEQTLALSRPLGDRKVIDATVGKAVGRPGFEYR